MAFVQELPEDLIIVALEVTQGKSNSLLVNLHESVQRILLFSRGRLILIIMRTGVNEEAKLTLLDVLLRLEETRHVGDVLKEGRPHQ